MRARARARISRKIRVGARTRARSRKGLYFLFRDPLCSVTLRHDMERKKVMLATGGTGGHVYPAMALADQLKHKEIDVLFTGGGLGKNRYFLRDQYPYEEVSCGNPRMSKPFSALFQLLKLIRGVLQSFRLISQFQPQLIVGFGSFYTVPPLIAGRLMGIPILLHEANRIPGKVNRLLSPYVAITGVQFPDTTKHLKGRVMHVPIPLRDGYRKGVVSAKVARDHFGIQPDIETVLIFGGSQGAKVLNSVVAESVTQLPEGKKIQVLHFTGDPDATKELEQKYREKGLVACVKDFESRMDLAWQAADFVISRAGAGTIAEAIEFEVPGILIPFPNAADNHQESNADFFVDVVKAGLKCRQQGLDAPQLIQALETISKDRVVMKKNIVKYKAEVPRRELSSIVEAIVSGA